MNKKGQYFVFINFAMYTKKFKLEVPLNGYYKVSAGSANATSKYPVPHIQHIFQRQLQTYMRVYIPSPSHM